MAKKQKSKSRLDKYYYLAKDHGFRSRASFKILQLNKKYNFFSNCSVCVDLCAAPGGWLQVAAKLMPISSLKIGIDLVPIKSIPGCTTITSDITTQDCRNKLEKELKHMKADVFLNDGAPNVGGNWNSDAYSQSELVLYSVKLASEFLKPGGWFITKIFRSSDYNSLIYVLNQLFKKVEATKPLASRQVSAEIFVVCQGFKNADIDPKLLDPKFALKQLEDEEDSKLNNIKSIKALLEAGTKRQRGGYYSNTLYKEREFSELVDCQNPFQFFYETNKIIAKSPKSIEYINCGVKQPKGYESYFEDLKVLGKGELQSLLFWRDKIRVKCFKKKKTLVDPNNPTDSSINPETYEETKMKQVDIEIKKLEKSKKKKLEASLKKKEKTNLKQKISFLKENDYITNESNDFDQSLFNYLSDNKINIEDLDYNPKPESDEESDEPDIEAEENDNASEYSDAYYEKMNDNIEDHLRQYKAEKDELGMKKEEQKKKKAQKRRDKRDEALEDQVSDIDETNIVNEKESHAEESEIKEDNNSDFDGSIDGDYDEIDENEEAEEDYDENDEEVKELKEMLMKGKKDKKLKEVKDTKPSNEIMNAKLVEVAKPIKTIKEGKEVKNLSNTDLNLKEEQKNVTDKKIKTKDAEKSEKTFNNPLKKLGTLNKLNKPEIKDKKDNKIPTDIEENTDSDTDSNVSTKKSKHSKQQKKLDSKSSLLGKKLKEDKHSNDEIKFVPSSLDHTPDLDEVAEIRALAKKMLRKKTRLEILEGSYNRYAFNDLSQAPDWFVEDEKKHNKKNIPVTKEEIAAERDLLLEINSRTPKKILEAKNRKKRKMAKQMDKIKKKAQAIVNQEEIGEGSKLRQIEKLYKKELNKNKPKKSYVVVRANQKVGKNSKTTRFVDKRLKKDKRAAKRIERRNKDKGIKMRKSQRKDTVVKNKKFGGKKGIKGRGSKGRSN